MKERRFLDLQSLPIQLQFSFVGLMVLITVIAGASVLGLIRSQLDRQAWARVDQGALATEALYASQQQYLRVWARLLAERPTVRSLLGGGDTAALADYLSVFRDGTPLDCVFVCDGRRKVVAQSGPACPTRTADLFSPDPSLAGGSEVEASGSYWLTAAAAIHDESEPEGAGTAVVAVALDRAFVDTWAVQTDLAHTLFGRDGSVATTLPEVPDADTSRFVIADTAYYARLLTLEEGLADQVALSIQDLEATYDRLVGVVVLSGLGIAIAGSLVGVTLARHIGRPLTMLAQSADALPDTADAWQADLEQLGSHWRVREVVQVARALERTRGDLVRALADLQQEKAWIEHLLAAIVEGIVTLDARGCITFFSRGAERVTGWSSDAVLGLPCDEVFKLAETDEPFSTVIPPPGGRVKAPVTLRDGRAAILALTSAQLVPPEGSTRMALVFRNVSEEEVFHRVMGYFVANVAHEFRTPLSALGASVEILLDQAPYLSQVELDELLNALHLSVLGLQTLIDNLLESASIETGQFRVHCRSVSIGEVITEAVHTVQPLLSKRGQRLRLDVPETVPPVRVDPRRTQQVLVNLLDNAHKYGPDDSEVRVQVTRAGSWVRVEVVDEGPGVPGAQRRELFRPFGRIRAAEEEDRVGTGLGLAVVKAIVEAQGGEVGLTSTPGEGAAFWFTLPIVEEDDPRKDGR